MEQAQLPDKKNPLNTMKLALEGKLKRLDPKEVNAKLKEARAKCSSLSGTEDFGP